MPDEISVSEYFEKQVPELFKEQVAGNPVMGMNDTVAAIQFDVKGAGGVQTYSVVIKDAKDIDIVAGPVGDPLVQVLIDEDDWREAVSGGLSGAADMFTDMKQMANRGRYDKLSDMKGKLVLDLTRPGKDNVCMEVVFNGAANPESTFKCSLDDWGKMSRGELIGMSAFMEGKLKIEGDMAFALSLSSLVS
jgi:putative sterol carrier protein